MALPISPAGRRYGSKHDKPNTKDLIHPLSFRGQKASPLPPNWDLEGCLGRVRDQGDLGACTAFAGCGMREFLFKTYNVWEKGTIQVAADTLMLSPLFLYYKEREAEGTLAEGDVGADMRSIPLTLNQVGVCQEIEDGYDSSQYNLAPNAAQITEAALFKAGAYHRIIGGASVMKSVIASGYAFVLGFDVYESFESQKVEDTGLMPVPDIKNEQLLGGHAVLVYGYNDTLHNGVLMVRNSWGSDWGLGGNFMMPYEVANSNVISDCWTQHLGPAWGDGKIAT